MNTKLLVRSVAAAVLVAFFGATFAVAAPPPEPPALTEPESRRAPIRRRLERYDTDKDGKFSEAERAAYFRQRLRGRIPADGSAFDTEFDGVVGKIQHFEQVDPISGTKDPTYAKVYAPADAKEKLPVIIVVPGGGGSPDAFQWAGQNLAQAGYVVYCLRVARHNEQANNPMHPSPNAWSFYYAAVSLLDCLENAEQSHFHTLADTSRVGTGFSQGSRAASHAAGHESRINAAVIFDNFQVSISGDDGSATCGAYPTPPKEEWVKPRIPVLGIASDGCRLENRDVKKTAFDHYRAHEIDTMLLVLEGWGHLRDFTEGKNGLAAKNEALLSHYTIAWFDQYLKKQDCTADLLTRNPPWPQTDNTKPGLEQLLDSKYRSGVFLKGKADYPDWKNAGSKP